MAKKKKKTFRPWCWYCDRDFEDEKVLLQHQKQKHFKCDWCSKKLSTASGMVIHAAQVHKETIKKVPNALPGRDSPDMDIFGMDGIPEADLAAHLAALEAANPKKKQKVDSGEAVAVGGSSNGSAGPSSATASALPPAPLGFHPAPPGFPYFPPPPGMPGAPGMPGYMFPPPPVGFPAMPHGLPPPPPGMPPFMHGFPPLPPGATPPMVRPGPPSHLGRPSPRILRAPSPHAAANVAPSVPAGTASPGDAAQAASAQSDAGDKETVLVYDDAEMSMRKTDSSAPATVKPTEGDDPVRPNLTYRERSTSRTYRLANLFMTFFFIYATYVQQNDPDSFAWMAFYSLCGLCAFLNTFDSIPVDPPLLPANLIGIYLFTLSLQASGIIPDGEGAFNKAAFKTFFDVHDENGRERAGIAISLFWITTARLNPSMTRNVALVAAAAGAITAAYYVPKYAMSWNDVKDVAHCHGLGATPADAPASGLPAGHAALMGSEEKQCPFTGRKAAPKAAAPKAAPAAAAAAAKSEDEEARKRAEEAKAIIDEIVANTPQSILKSPIPIPTDPTKRVHVDLN
ncbi:hypothetical protein H9P43_000845 [Blastocladiella emersonii ATCC 22665]|nr:hypothetical protein H9P43_000845 [Blastocladiella emersonii ATCC 22665]